MHSVYFATSNTWKFNEAKEYFRKKGIALKQFENDFEEPREEDGVKVAKLKAIHAFEKLGEPVFVLDGSLYIKALNDFPKSYVKFFDKYLGAQGLLKLLKGEKNRNWEFANILSYKDKDNAKTFINLIKGTIAEKITHNKMGQLRDFDRLLIAEGTDKTYAEFTKKELGEYDEKVWRPNVFDKFIDWYKTLKAKIFYCTFCSGNIKSCSNK